MKKGISLNFRRISIVLISLFFAYACSKDDNVHVDEGFDGSYLTIEELLGQGVLDSLVDLGMVVNPGSNPPIIEGKYHLSPTILESSNIPGDLIGWQFNDADLEFSDQDNNNLTIIFDAQEALGDEHTGSGAFISGDGDEFSVFLISESKSDEYIGETIFVISAKKLEDGLTDFQLAFFMVDNGGNPGAIPNGSGRIFVDGDDFVEKI